MFAVAAVRRRLAAVWAAAFVTILFFFFFYREAALAKASQWGVTSKPHSKTELPLFHTNSDSVRRVAILETGGTHDEVTAALVHAFGGQPDVELALLLKKQRYQMEDIMDEFDLRSPPSKIVSSDDFPKAMDMKPHPHILVSTTCHLDISVHTAAFRRVLSHDDTFLFCVMHHADKWDKGNPINVVRDFLGEDKAAFIGLSEHTVNFLTDKVVPGWKSDFNVPVHVFPPVFPVSLPETDEGADLSLALQGDYSSGRRDYKHTFEQLGGLIEELSKTGATADERSKTVALHVIGHGHKPEVPEELQDNVIFDEDLSYPDFYSILSRAFSIIPAFASDDYLDRKASSTVPAALIAGAPMVATEDMLKSYTYLTREAVWLSEPEEDELDTVKRFIGDTDGYLQRARAMRETRDKLMRENRELVAKWLGEATSQLSGIWW